MTSWNGKTIPRYWPYVREINRSPVNSPHKDQWRGALMFSLICAWINAWVNNRKTGDLRRHRVHYDVIVIILIIPRSVMLCDSHYCFSSYIMFHHWHYHFSSYIMFYYIARRHGPVIWMALHNEGDWWMDTYNHEPVRASDYMYSYTNPRVV